VETNRKAQGLGGTKERPGGREIRGDLQRLKGRLEKEMYFLNGVRGKMGYGGTGQEKKQTRDRQYARNMKSSNARALA